MITESRRWRCLLLGSLRWPIRTMSGTGLQRGTMRIAMGLPVRATAVVMRRQMLLMTEMLRLMTQLRLSDVHHTQRSQRPVRGRRVAVQGGRMMWRHCGVQYAAFHIRLHGQHIVGGALPVRKQFEGLQLKATGEKNTHTNTPANGFNPISRNRCNAKTLVFLNYSVPLIPTENNTHHPNIDKSTNI